MAVLPVAGIGIPMRAVLLVRKIKWLKQAFLIVTMVMVVLFGWHNEVIFDSG
jgi:hypothetical protein